MYIVELEPGVWLAPWGGDPGRTVLRCSARNFKREHLACNALERARRFRKFENARVILISFAQLAKVDNT